MDIKTKFSINQKVFIIHQDYAKKWVTCGFCGGKGNIIGVNGSDHSCPECWGDGGKNQVIGLAWMPMGEFTIGRVQTTIINITSDGMFDNIGHYVEGEDKQETDYMVYEKGVGSGYVFKEHDVFASLEEANTECAKRNAVLVS